MAGRYRRRQGRVGQDGVERGGHDRTGMECGEGIPVGDMIR